MVQEVGANDSLVYSGDDEWPLEVPLDAEVQGTSPSAKGRDSCVVSCVETIGVLGPIVPAGWDDGYICATVDQEALASPSVGDKKSVLAATEVS